MSPGVRGLAQSESKVAVAAMFGAWVKLNVWEAVGVSVA
jgi:hypothetical protein